MQQHYEIFQEVNADKKFCPPMTCIDDREEIESMIDWGSIKDAPCINDDGEAIVVIGYYKKTEDGKNIFFTRVVTFSSKTHQKAYIQHRPEERYDIIALYTCIDGEGNPIWNEHDRYIACIKVEGTLKETLAMQTTARDRRIYGEITKDIALPMDGKIRIFEADFIEKKAVKKRRKRKTTKAAA